ncbi:MAG TPA: hypothetical protein VEQ18_00860 [Candidatus Nitrosocosmicus sp.]|nr:hypothetical protein [Candidatus Nitrosocosmicus sp.]
MSSRLTYKYNLGQNECDCGRKNIFEEDIEEDRDDPDVGNEVQKGTKFVT